MFNLNTITNEKNKDHNKKWPYIPDHPYKMLIIGSSGSGALDDDLIDNIYFYAKDLSEPKYLFLIEKREDIRTAN